MKHQVQGICDCELNISKLLVLVAVISVVVMFCSIVTFATNREQNKCLKMLEIRISAVETVVLNQYGLGLVNQEK